MYIYIQQLSKFTLFIICNVSAYVQLHIANLKVMGYCHMSLKVKQNLFQRSTRKARTHLGFAMLKPQVLAATPLAPFNAMVANDEVQYNPHAQCSAVQCTCSSQASVNNFVRAYASSFATH